MKKFIRLMHSNMEYVMVINPDHIVNFYDRTDGECTIKFSNGDMFCTKTKAEDVAELIEKSYK